tara:strand:- start:226 stop:894 length:669 start_codon:yes stop_codon:yes gene_type:complete
MELSPINLSLLTSGIATLINLPIAVLVGWLISKLSLKTKSIIETIVMLPLVLPPVVVGFALLKFFGMYGFGGKLISNLFSIDIAFTWIAATIAAAVMSFPLMARSIISAMESIDNRFEQVARTLGANPIQVFFTITIPLAKRGIFAGIIVGFVRALGEFGATIIFAGNIDGKSQTIPLAIFTEMQLGHTNTAGQLALISAAIAIVSIFIYNWISNSPKDSKI